MVRKRSNKDSETNRMWFIHPLKMHWTNKVTHTGINLPTPYCFFIIKSQKHLFPVSSNDIFKLKTFRKYLRAVKFFEVRAEVLSNTQVNSHQTDDGCLADTALCVLEALPSQTHTSSCAESHNWIIIICIILSAALLITHWVSKHLPNFRNNFLESQLILKIPTWWKQEWISNKNVLKLISNVLHWNDARVHTSLFHWIRKLITRTEYKVSK